MQIWLEQNQLKVKTPCKINPFLEVMGRRDDGYHELNTIMIGIDLCDELSFTCTNDNRWELRIEPNSAWISDQIGYNGQGLGDVRQNLVWRALELLAAELNVQKGISVVLRKSIPIQAGLGGGSSDAAATLVAAQWLWTGHYNQELACKLAAKLGSDVNFFLEGYEDGMLAATCRGRGEQVTPLHIATDCGWLLVCPKIGCNTGSVFRCVELPKVGSRSMEGVVEVMERSTSCESLIDQAFYNRLFDAATIAYPNLKVFYEQLENIAPQLRFKMSGSGSSFFAVFDRNATIKVEELIAQVGNCLTHVGNCWKTRSIAEQIDDLSYKSIQSNS